MILLASSVIHLAVANEVNKTLKKDNTKLLIGAIAPDIWKPLGNEKEKSHFLTIPENNIPDINKFLNIYKNFLDDDFVLGYYIHLYTDYLWFKYFIPEIFDDEKEIITKLDGTTIKCNGNMLSLYIYNDYTNLNLKLIENYQLDLSMFYQKTPTFKNIIQEIPMDKIEVIINTVKEIIEQTKVHKDLIFNMDNIYQFIKEATKLINSNLKELGIEK